MIESLVGVYLCIGLAVFIETVCRRRKQINEKLQHNDLSGFPILIPIAATVAVVCGLFVNVFFWPFLLMNKLRNTE